MRSCTPAPLHSQASTDTRPPRQSSEQPGNLGASLDKAEKVVHEQKDILPALVAKIFRDRERGERDAPTRAGRLIHLSIDEHGSLEHAGVAHIEQHLVSFARALAHAGDTEIPL
jgi:hypothetical protein